MLNLFKKKEKLPLCASGEYNGTYNPIKDSVLSAELLFDHDSVTFLFDKGVDALLGFLEFLLGWAACCCQERCCCEQNKTCFHCV